MLIHFPINTRLRDGSPVRLSLAGPKDIEPLHRLYGVIVAAGNSFPHEQTPLDDEFRAYWFGGYGTVVASVSTGTGSTDLAGAYYVKANWPGRARHVANAGFIVAPEWRGKGLARLLGETMLDHARSVGFRSVIFNLVFSENHVAHRLWKQLGFHVLATLPQAVRKDDGTYQDALIMFRSLIDDASPLKRGSSDGSDVSR